ncbi:MULTISPECIES: CRISPR-associated endonuclease Cas2 [Thermodesulfobacterium]|jgi:CRISPR-associated protein Cas2|uniref:CRISPR-associated endoribonuclease Cas2 n=1 Tax=Thermodesulfobacterium commune TaxID=1741 RepID=A0A3B8N3F4_9BACT|nr:CRISPR-associated endonuclease Cas2 [Thermodesulfobacterium sp.]HAA83645.1 CRISPR-associated endonuclease Cas2 [Thermodesulfobacterium commune]MBZ4682404.1 cas2 [Thermodesulfobacterium sp.]MDK2861556.1 CRISPR-associated protein Cas2 [Thermodesulfobacterium sp.]MDN5380427.1 CRISPR-associated protein Cas2 [Thermodesulfobacterium sp.]HBT03745.1 CRISPR-associated endonuclease Cas2 [Thermodesulfobacterium commune]
MDYLIVYDISDHKKRRKVARLLQKLGYRVQYSAFYLPDISKNKIEALYEKLQEIVDKDTDRIFFYPVDPPEIFEGYLLEPWKVFVFFE